MLFDKYLNEIMDGDILYHDEGDGFQKGIILVTAKNDNLMGSFYIINDVDKSSWIEPINDMSFLLSTHYSSKTRKDKKTMIYSEIIGHIDSTPSYLTLKYIEKNYLP